MSTDSPPPPAPVCEQCDATMVRGERGAWFCCNCDGDEAGALDREDDERIARADADYEAHPPGCTCRDFDETQCDVHGPAVIAQMAAEYERARMREALATIVALPDAWSGVPWQRLCRWAARVLAEMERDR